MARLRFLCDVERCIDCNACVTACKNENEVPWGVPTAAGSSRSTKASKASLCQIARA